MKSMLSRLIFIIIFIVFAQTISYACSCLKKPTVMSEFVSADVVMIVRADSFASQGNPAIMGVSMVVERVFKGAIKPGQQLFFNEGGGGDCSYYFGKVRKGKQFLIYSNVPNDGIWKAGICGRDQWIETAGDDLLFLNNLTKSQGKSRVSGVLRIESDDETSHNTAISGLKVRIKGNGIIRETVTNSDGVYEFLDLPPGVYSIIPESYPQTLPPFGRMLFDYYNERRATSQRKEIYRKAVKSSQNQKQENPKSYSFYLFPKGSGGYDFYYDKSNTVKGRVTGPEGKPLESADITFVKENGDVPNQRIEQTDAAGNYIIPRLSPGKYYIAVNSHGFVSADNPFKTTYYPGVQNLSQAKLLDLNGGEELKNINIHIPDLAPTVWISGKVVYADDVPVEEADVKFESINEPEKVIGDSKMRTSNNGEFKIKVLKGLQGDLSAEKLFWNLHYKDCLKGILTAKIISNNSYGPTIATNPISINADSDIIGLVIKYPLKSCPKGK